MFKEPKHGPAHVPWDVTGKLFPSPRGPRPASALGRPGSEPAFWDRLEVTAQLDVLHFSRSLVRARGGGTGRFVYL